MNKKQNKTVYISGKFKDYAGIERPFTMCAVSVGTELAVVSEDGIENFTPKALYLGLSVVHPEDINRKKKVKVNGTTQEVPVYDEEIGQQIAYGKAMNPKSRLGSVYVDHPGLINTSVVNALLKQESDHFIANPANYIMGYDKARIEYNFNQLGGNDAVKAIKAQESVLNEMYKNLNELELKSIKNK